MPQWRQCTVEVSLEVRLGPIESQIIFFNKSDQDLSSFCLKLLSTLGEVISNRGEDAQEMTSDFPKHIFLSGSFASKFWKPCFLTGSPTGEFLLKLKHQWLLVAWGSCCLTCHHRYSRTSHCLIKCIKPSFWFTALHAVAPSFLARVISHHPVMQILHSEPPISGEQICLSGFWLTSPSSAPLPHT